jgi:hypothetical protein
MWAICADAPVFVVVGGVQAIKVLAIGDPDSEVNKDIRKEIDILRKCKSPHVVSYFGTALQKAPDGTYDLWVRHRSSPSFRASPRS